MDMEDETENGPSHGSPETPADLISALPDDLLVQVLDRFGSRCSAARTSLLSRRWRGLWTRLPCVTVAFHEVPLLSLEAALAHAARPGVCHYYLDICVPLQADPVTADSISSLLRAAAALSPVEMLFVFELAVQVPGLLDVNHLIPTALIYELPWVNLPRFDRATAIDLRARHLRLVPPSSGFPLLERLWLTGCEVDLAALIPRCPRIRMLWVNYDRVVAMDGITIHSASLQELTVQRIHGWTPRIDVEAPMLKQLNLYFHARGDLRVSVSAPMAEKVSWRCSYSTPMYRLGIWCLLELEVGLNTIHSGLPSVQHVLSLHIVAQTSDRYVNAEHTFAAEIHKHMVSKFSALDLHLTTTGHAFGPFVLSLFGMHRIRRAIRNLRIVIQRSQVEETCRVNCVCGEPKDWRTQTISLAGLETVQIEGLHGEDHEFDFLEVMFASARMLKRVTLRLADGVTPCVDWCTKVNNTFKAYLSVKCKVDLGQYVAAKDLH